MRSLATRVHLYRTGWKSQYSDMQPSAPDVAVLRQSDVRHN